MAMSSERGSAERRAREHAARTSDEQEGDRRELEQQQRQRPIAGLVERGQQQEERRTDQKNVEPAGSTFSATVGRSMTISSG